MSSAKLTVKFGQKVPLKIELASIFSEKNIFILFTLWPHSLFLTSKSNISIHYIHFEEADEELKKRHWSSFGRRKGGDVADDVNSLFIVATSSALVVDDDGCDGDGGGMTTWPSLSGT